MDATIKEDRSLRQDEKVLLLRLIEQSGDEYRKYVCQVNELRVVSRCGCGCPSIDFEEPAAGKSHNLLDFMGATADGLEVGLIVWANEERLTGLEVYTFGAHEGYFGLPTLESLKPIGPDHKPIADSR